MARRRLGNLRDVRGNESRSVNPSNQNNAARDVSLNMVLFAGGVPAFIAGFLVVVIMIFLEEGFGVPFTKINGWINILILFGTPLGVALYIYSIDDDAFLRPVVFWLTAIIATLVAVFGSFFVIEAIFL